MLDAGGLRGLRHIARALVLHRLEGLLAGCEQDADEVHDRVSILRRRHQRVGVAHIGLDRNDLADTPKRLKMAGKIGTADGHPDARAGAGDGPDQMAAQESRAAINGYECSVVQCDGHVDASFAGRVEFRRCNMP